LSDEVKTGDVITEGRRPSSAHRGVEPRVLTTPRIVATIQEKRNLAQRTNAVAVDTESSAWAEAAKDHNVPCVIVRVILDTATENVPPFIVDAQRQDGSIDRNAILRYALKHPQSIPELLRMRTRMQACAEKLAGAVVNEIAPDHLDALLRATSRTFSLCIPLLPQPVRNQVTIAYLLFRIADTFEDASDRSVADRVRALDDFCALLRTREPACARELTARWTEQFPLPHAGYRELLAELPLVIHAFAALEPNVVEVIASRVIRSAEGMSEYVQRSASGPLQLDDVADLRRYCYTVAGIVGEMLTELFVLAAPETAPIASFLRARAATFGEALQLVNILKDSADDKREGRTYIPQRTARSEVFALVRNDLDVATEYTLALQNERAPRGIVAFVALPVALARATLERVEAYGPGAKISRPEVFRITRRLDRALARNKPALAFESPTAFIPMLKRSLLGG
jgi:farnesyl-diphosphate farnesyltransferase